MLTQEIKDFFKDKNVVVTGGTGLVGRQLLEILVPISKNVISISLDDLKPVEGVIYDKVDLREFKVCKELIEEGDIVFHTAGIKGNPDVTSTNVSTMFVPYLQFNTNVLEACRVKKVSRVVFTSTIGAYSSKEIFVEEGIFEGKPMDTWAGWAKRMAEAQIESYKIQYGLKNFIACRLANIYGPGDNFDPDNAMVIPSLISKIDKHQICSEPMIVWGDGSAIRDFAYSKDVAEGLIQAAYYMPDVPYLNLGSGKGITIKELVDILKEVIEGFEFIYDKEKPNGFPKRIMDIELAKELIGYNPRTSLEEGLKETWEWFIQNKQEYLKRKNYFKEDV